MIKLNLELNFNFLLLKKLDNKESFIETLKNKFFIKQALKNSNWQDNLEVKGGYFSKIFII